MTEISRTASYAKSSKGRDTAFPTKLGEPAPALSERIWSLLETPQTVESLCRVLKTEAGHDPGDCRPQTEAFFAKLLEAELIELLPDS